MKYDPIRLISVAEFRTLSVAETQHGGLSYCEEGFYNSGLCDNRWVYSGMTLFRLHTNLIGDCMYLNGQLHSLPAGEVAWLCSKCWARFNVLRTSFWCRSSIKWHDWGEAVVFSCRAFTCLNLSPKTFSDPVNVSNTTVSGRNANVMNSVATFLRGPCGIHCLEKKLMIMSNCLVMTSTVNMCSL